MVEKDTTIHGAREKIFGRDFPLSIAQALLPPCLVEMEEPAGERTELLRMVDPHSRVRREKAAGKRMLTVEDPQEGAAQKSCLQSRQLFLPNNRIR